MAGLPADELARWADAIARLHDTVSGRSGERAARLAVARLWSGFGYRGESAETTEMIIQAIEVGYMTALRDLATGTADPQ